MEREELEKFFETVFKGKRSIGTDYLSSQDKERARQYAYMQYEL